MRSGLKVIQRTNVIVSKDRYLSPETQIPTSPSPFGGKLLGKNGEIGGDGETK